MCNGHLTSYLGKCCLNIVLHIIDSNSTICALENTSNDFHGKANLRNFEVFVNHHLESWTHSGSLQEAWMNNFDKCLLVTNYLPPRNTFESLLTLISSIDYNILNLIIAHIKSCWPFLHSPFCRAEGLCQHAAIKEGWSSRWRCLMDQWERSR
jgi:hypothetical protein